MLNRQTLYCATLILAASVAFGSEDEYREDLLQARADYDRFSDEENWPAAADAAARLLDIASAAFDDGDPRLTQAGINYALIQAKMGDRRDAARTLDRLANNIADAHGEKSTEMIPILIAQGDLIASRRRVQRQMEYYEKVLAITKTEFGRNSIEYADRAFELGVKVLTMSLSGGGLIYIKRAHRIYKGEFGAEDYRTAQASFMWGVIENSSGFPYRARRHFKAALTGFDLADESARQYAIRARELLAGAMIASGDEDEVLEQLLEIGRIKEDYSEPFDTRPFITKVPPDYPAVLYEQEIEGFVKFRFTIDESGFVRSPEVVEAAGHEGFVEPAMESVLSQRYVPKVVNGQAVAVDGMLFTVNFEIH